LQSVRKVLLLLFLALLAIRFAYGPPSTGDVQPTGNGSSTGSPLVWPTIGEDAILEMAFQETFENLTRDIQIDTKYRTAPRAVCLPVNDGNYIYLSQVRHDESKDHRRNHDTSIE
jgi:hypothetical protein